MKVIFLFLCAVGLISTNLFGMKNNVNKSELAVEIAALIDNSLLASYCGEEECVDFRATINKVQAYIAYSEQQRIFHDKIDAAVARVFASLVKFAFIMEDLTVDEKNEIYQTAIRMAQWIGFTQVALPLWKALFDAGQGINEAIEHALLNVPGYALPLWKELLLRGFGKDAVRGLIKKLNEKEDNEYDEFVKVLQNDPNIVFC